MLKSFFFNNFRWSPELIESKSLLLLLEGHQVMLPAPKNHFSCDINIERDTPVFATSKCEITFRAKYNLPDKLEHDMRKSRWKLFPFHSIIAPENKKKCSSLWKMLFTTSFNGLYSVTVYIISS